MTCRPVRSTCTACCRSADAHLGIHSTVLTEAVATGTRNLLADTLASSDLLGYVEAGVAMPVRNGADFLAALDAPDGITPEARSAFLARHFERGPGERSAPRRSPGVARMSGRTLFLIPARGGSKRIPAKNLRHLAGIPLVAWAGRIARAAAAAGDVIVCSTDDAEIAAVATTWGLRVLDRPAELATDTATSVDVALHALDAAERDGEAIDLFALVQPTSPLTDPADLRAAIDLARETGRSVVSVTTSHPAAWHHGLGADDGLRPVDAEDADRLLTGAFYVTTPDALRRSRRFVEPRRDHGVRDAS